MEERVLWSGEGVFVGSRIVRRADGIAELRTPDYRTILGRFVRVETPEDQAADGPRVLRLSVRLSAGEYTAVQERAARAGLSVSDFTRLVLLAQP